MRQAARAAITTDLGSGVQPARLPPGLIWVQVVRRAIEAEVMEGSRFKGPIRGRERSLSAALEWLDSEGQDDA